MPEALAAYDRTVERFPDNAVARNGRATILAGLGRTDEARLLLAPAGSQPGTRDDWVAAHILCMIDLRAGASPALADRLRRLVLACPYPSHRRYFETTLAVVQLALRDPAEARKAVGSLLARADFEPGERQVLHLMQAHAEAADGDLDAARQSLAAASNVVPYEQFAARQLRSKIERRYGLGTQRALTGGEEIAASEEKIIWLEADAWGTRAAEVAQAERMVA
ncbi:MAG TPA: hypothetical protein VND19_07720 [Acetobacteraceae bacterium]|nr:hypothetical protein [Acetobacteraceae bacterium]